MKTSGTNLEHARVHNRRVVIEAVRLHGTLTQAELARITALTPQTVSILSPSYSRWGCSPAMNRVAPQDAVSRRCR